MKLSKPIAFFSKTVLLFLYVFNLKFIGFEFLPTIRIAFIVLFLMYGLPALRLLKNEVRQNPIIFIVFAAVFVWALLSTVLGYSAAPGIFNSVFVFFVFSVFGAILFSIVFESREELLKVFLFVVAVQAFFVYVSFASVGFRQFTASILVESGNIPLLSGSRVAGFSNGSGSTLSFTLALGVFSAMLLLIKAAQLKVKAMYMCLAVFITVSCIFVGKLGLLFSVCAILLASLFAAMQSLKGLWHFVALWLSGLVVAVCSLLSIFVLFPEVQGQFAYALFRSFSILLSGEDSTATALLEMPVPELGINTIVGHGGLSTFGHPNATHSDIGYVQSYYALGLIFSVLLYSALFVYLLKKLIREKGRSSFVFLSCVLLFLFVSELKEPFIFKVNFVFFLLLLFLVEAKKGYMHWLYRDPELACR